MTYAGDNDPFAGPGPDARYHAFLEAGEFRIQRCSDCGGYQFFPRVLCSHCGSAAVELVPASGGGTVYSCTTIREKPEKGGPRNLSIIALDEGPRLFSRVDGIAPEDVRIGMSVRARIAEEDGARFVVFYPL